MMICGCSGSTAGGPKVFRYQLLARGGLRRGAPAAQPERRSSPRTSRARGRRRRDRTRSSPSSCSSSSPSALGAVALVLLGLDPVSAISGAAACLSNVGPGLGPVLGPVGNYARLNDAGEVGLLVPDAGRAAGDHDRLRPLHRRLLARLIDPAARRCLQARRPGTGPAPMPADAPRSFQEIILRLQAYWAAPGLRHPAALRHGGRRRHLPPGHHAALARPRALVRRLRPALAPPDRRPLRRQPEPLAALLPVPGHHQTLAARLPGPLPRLASPPSASTWSCTTSASSRTTGRARPSAPGASAGRSGATAWRSVAVHLLPAGRRPRLPPGLGRAHLRPRAPRDVRPRLRRRQPHAVQRPRRADPAHLRRRLPRGRGGIRPLELRRRRHRHAAPPLRGRRGRMRPHPRPARHRPEDRPAHRHGAAGLRPVHQGQPPLQPARRPRRDLGHRAPGLHRPGPRAGEDVRRRLRPRPRDRAA